MEELLRKGKFYCNTRQYFQELEHKLLTRGQGDRFEQTHSIENTENLKIEITHTDGTKKFENWNQGRIVTNDLINFGHIYCFTQIESFSKLKKLDERLLSWGESCIIISDPDSLINRIKEKLDNLGIEHEARKVDYKNLNELGKIKMNPFIKNNDLSYQQEFRLFLKTEEQNPFEFEIGSIKDISEIIETKKIKNSA